MDKTLEFYGKTADGKPLVHLVEPGTGYGLSDSAGLDKVASGEHLPQVMELIESIQAQPDRLYLVNSALGAGEWVGFNLRGDWFTERSLIHTPPGWDRIPVWDIDARRRAAAQTEAVPGWGTMAWGYPTFYNAHRFRHHVNKDPERAYGFILGAFWDARMHRVVLVSELVRSMCERLGALDIYERIARGEFPDTSMGAKVPYDRCSICNHVAKTPRDYCVHVRAGALPPYGMRALLPDGRRCGVYNDYPRFFDDSYVFIGAERSAKVMANITKAVRGTRPYGTQLYQPSAAHLMSRETVADVSVLPRREQEKALADAMQDVLRSRVVGPTEKGVAAAISRSLSAIPTLDKSEERALLHAERVERQRAAKKDRTLTDEEYRFWEEGERAGLTHEGVAPEQAARALAMLRSKLQSFETPKLGSLAKWATHVKDIPAPSSAQVALLRDHTSRLSRVLPAPVEGMLREPGALWPMLSMLAHLGVVLRPDEFQHASLCSMGQGGYAGELRQGSALFEPTPLDPQRDPSWAPATPDRALLGRLASLLGPALEGRSFAPKIVAIRIVHPPAHAHGGDAHEMVRSSLLNRVSQMYNDYRTGLLAHPPGWGYVPASPLPVRAADMAKLGDAADAVSTLLLHLAYWHPDNLG